MTEPRRRSTRLRRERELEDAHRRHVRSPCDRPPITPERPWSEFDRKGATRYHRLRAKFRWDEVHTDTSGFHITIRHYELHLQYSAHDAPDTWFDEERYIVPRKDDNEPNDLVHFIVKGSIVANLAYRWRVRAVADGGCKGLWTAWQSMGDAGGDNPPAPLNVTVYDGSLDRIVVDWDHAPDLDDDEILDERVAHYACEISKQQDFQPVYKRDVFVHGTQRTFKVAAADMGDIFFARAWSVGTSRDKSAKIPAKLVPNNDPGALADGVVVERSKVRPGKIEKFTGDISDLIPPVSNEYLRCDGALYSTTVYAELFAKIGYRYGGSGGQFAVPDHRRRVAKGVGSGQAEGDTDGMAEFDRDEDHGKHRKHRHKHKHKHRHRNIDQHASGSVAQGGDGQHDHGVGTLQLPAVDTSVPHAGQAGASGTQGVFGSGHTHTVPVTGITGRTGSVGSGHQHNVDPAGAGTTTYRTVRGASVAGMNLPPYSEPGHGDLEEVNQDADTDPDEFTSSLTGGTSARTGATWTAEETDVFGTPLDIDDLQAPAGKGHKGHPHLKVHYLIKT